MFKFKKAQTIVSLFFVIIIFIFMWGLFLSDFLKLGGEMAVDNGAGGVEAFFYGNLNLFVFIIFILAVLAWFALSGGGG